MNQPLTTTEIFELRQQGNTEAAYEAARQRYATDKSPAASVAMFWTAIDMLRKVEGESQHAEAQRIFLALQRLLPHVPDKEGRAHHALENCRKLLEGEKVYSTKNSACSEHNEMGRWGEEMAANYLYGKGYDIVERDWHSGHRDIDIIVQRGNLYVFVEVKTRRNRDFGDPLDAIDPWKRHNLFLAINHYIQYRRIDRFRFDIITVVGTPDNPTPEICHYEDIPLEVLEQSGRPKRSHRRY